LGPASVGAGGRGGGGFGGPRINYAYLPGQTLAPEEIYFDYLSDLTHLTGKYLSHFDGVVQVLSDAQLGAAQQAMLNGFKDAGNGVIKYSDGKRPTDTVLRAAVLSAVSKQARSG